MAAPLHQSRPNGLLGLVLTLVAVELALTTAYIHFTLGGTLFMLNAAGYVALAAGMLLFALPHGLAARFAWVPRLGLLGYTVTTIVAYLVMGPYFTLGWVAKAIEVGLVLVLAADLLRLYGSPGGLLRAVLGSLRSDSGRMAAA